VKKKILRVPALIFKSLDVRISEGGKLSLTLKDVVHVNPIGLFRGHSSCGGVRLRKKSLFFEVGHFVAYGGGASPLEITLGQASGPYGFVGFDIFVNHCQDHFQLPFREHLFHLLVLLALCNIECQHVLFQSVAYQPRKQLSRLVRDSRSKIGNARLHATIPEILLKRHFPELLAREVGKKSGSPSTEETRKIPRHQTKDEAKRTDARYASS